MKIRDKSINQMVDVSDRDCLRRKCYWPRPDPGLFKVTTRLRGATHVNDPKGNSRTLCGRVWHFRCDLGTDFYCRACQRKLAKIYQPNVKAEVAK